MLKYTAVGIALACFAGGCGQSMDQLGGKASPQLSSGDNSFFKTITISNQTEIQSSQLALTQSQNSGVKDFAKKMIEDHNSAGAQVAALAATKDVMLPTTIDSSHQTLVDNLKGKTGTDFDKAYIDLQVNAHKETITADEDEANNGTDSQVKILASKLLDTLKMHEQMAEKLQTGM